MVGNRVALKGAKLVRVVKARNHARYEVNTETLCVVMDQFQEPVAVSDELREPLERE